MKQGIFTILENKRIAKQVYQMQLQGNTAGIRAGQFVNISLSQRFLRRPISVCDIENDILTLVYKVVGGGTTDMSQLQPNARLDLLTCLGNGYDLSAAGENPLLIGGGTGVPPLYMVAKQLRTQGKKIRVILGFNSADEVFYENKFRSLECEIAVATTDGSYGTKGLVTELLNGKQSYYYACGPLPMLKSLIQKAGKNGEMSLEERMGCGFGVCVGCTLRTTDGYKRVCKDGPVFKSSELILENE